MGEGDYAPSSSPVGSPMNSTLHLKKAINKQEDPNYSYGAV